MYTNHYATFSEAYQLLNQELAGSGIHTTTSGCHCIPEPMVIGVDRAEWDIPLENICYSTSKFKQLEREYLDRHGLEAFKEKVGQLGWRSCAIYQFKRKPPRCGVERDNCLQYITYHKAEDLYMVHWRTTELGMRWGADLAWIATLLPGVRVILDIPHSYQHLHCWPGVTETLGITPKLFPGVYRDIFLHTREMYYGPNLSEDNLAKWGPINMIQKRVIQMRGAKNGV